MLKLNKECDDFWTQLLAYSDTDGLSNSAKANAGVFSYQNRVFVYGVTFESQSIYLTIEFSTGLKLSMRQLKGVWLHESGTYSESMTSIELADFCIQRLIAGA